MHTSHNNATALLHRWQRLQMHVRCGLSVQQPECIRCYLQAGLALVRHGIRPDTRVHLSLLHTLLQTAQDQALPWFWRSVCLEHVHLPLVKLGATLGLHDPLAMQAIRDAVDLVRDHLPNTPSTPNTANWLATPPLPGAARLLRRNDPT